ncbi:hypothetical protein VNO77_08345 [Canavalia gladiata]|uniref:Uncharacterized protein n=1 Tax=Canavalia gladiata TaxID=3824 RepID=A0AAN9QTR8_CANGL
MASRRVHGLTVSKWPGNQAEVKHVPEFTFRLWEHIGTSLDAKQAAAGEGAVAETGDDWRLAVDEVGERRTTSRGVRTSQFGPKRLPQIRGPAPARLAPASPSSRSPELRGRWRAEFMAVQRAHDISMEKRAYMQNLFNIMLLT